jgi:ComF family protein
MMLPSFKRALLDLIFPPKCIYCNALLAPSETQTCSRCLEHLPWIKPEDALLSGTHFSHCVSVAWYEGEIRNAFLRYKFRGQRRYAEAFSFLLAQKIALHFEGRYDWITWVPLSEESLKARGYDQSFLLSAAVAQELGQQPHALFRKPLHKTPQSSLSSAEARRHNINGCFTLIDPTSVQGKRILLIDDVITTGSTLEEASKHLLCADAKEVLCATFCRTRLISS